jgi:hypothetical protein
MIQVLIPAMDDRLSAMKAEIQSLIPGVEVRL